MVTVSPLMQPVVSSEKEVSKVYLGTKIPQGNTTVLSDAELNVRDRVFVDAKHQILPALQRR